jgi:diaminopimelate decarboxylase
MNPFSNPQLLDLAGQFGTPVWAYDAATIQRRIAQLKSFDAIRFAQKACSNIHILRLMKAAGVAVDAVSLGEIERARRAGLTQTSDPVHSEVVFTADLIDRPTLNRVVADRIPVNAGSIDMLNQIGEVAPGHPVWLRINPGFGHGHSNKTNTGGEHSKHGIWHSDLPHALAAIQRHGLRLIGLHMHIGSGVDYAHLAEVCGAMVSLVRAVHAQGHDIQAISAGGGLSIPYQPGDPEVDTDHYFKLWDSARREAASIVGHALQLEIEPGRFLVAESGVLISEVRAVKDMGSNHFVLVDAGFNELMRPTLYGSHHGISIIPRSREAGSASPRPTVVAGPLCESGDVFTQLEGGVVTQRDLPEARVGDLLVFHDTGAYGSAMSSTYNSRPLIPEVLVEPGGQPRLIRRRQTLDELLGLENL